MSSTNGLKTIVATSIECSGEIRLNTTINSGTVGQVIKSNGINQPAFWDDETPHTNQSLTMGDNVNLTSGNPSFDGSVAETINAIDTTYQAGQGINIDTSITPNAINNTVSDTTYQAGVGISINTGTKPDTINNTVTDTTYQGSTSILITTIPGTDPGISVIKVPNKLNIGANLTTTSGDLFYDGSAIETISALATATPQQLTMGKNLYLTSGNTTFNGGLAETINTHPSNLYRDVNSSKYYRMLKPTDFMNDNDVSGYNKTTISDAFQHGSMQCNGGTQYYVMFEIPTGFNFTGYRVNLVNSAGTPQGTSPKGNFYSQPGYKGVNTTLTLLGSAASYGYNTFITLPTPTGNGWSNTWTINNTLNFGVIMCYKNPWSTAEFNRGGYIEFTLI